MTTHMSEKQHEFVDKFLGGLLQDCFQFQSDNVDLERFPEAEGGVSRRVKDHLLSVAASNNLYRRGFNLDSANRALAGIVGQIHRYQKLYDLLGDQRSRDLLVELLKYRVLGPNHVRLPLNNADYRKLRTDVDSRYLVERGTYRAAGRMLNRYKLENGIEMHLHPVVVCTTFSVEHYAYRGSETIAAQPDDVVVDGGGCWGDTALYFADKVSPSGRVFCYEFDSANLKILEENLGLNPALQKRIDIVQNALWDKSGEAIEYAAHGPATTLNASGMSAAGSTSGSTVTTLTIDDLAAQQKLERVDFIKMDVEGAELRALKGAESVLRKHRPKLAISLYHKPDDFVEIPEYLLNLDLGYRFFLGHYTIHQEETVVFATARAASRK
jgi:FkbM family methyltransferase